MYQNVKGYCVLCDQPTQQENHIVCSDCWVDITESCNFLVSGQLLADVLYMVEGLWNVGGMLIDSPFCTEHNASIDYALRQRGYTTRWVYSSKLIAVIESLLGLTHETF